MYFDTFFEATLGMFTFERLLVLFGATSLGIIFGAMPGLTATLGVALLSTLTMNLQTDIAMIALIGVYVGAIYGGCHASILLGIPGTAAAAATALDGYPLAKQGRAGEAIATATVASAIGTLIGLLAILLLVPVLTELALQFTSVEFFLLAIFGILICGTLTSEDMPVKGWIAGLLGLSIAMVGIETIQSYHRFTFGLPELTGGIDIVPVILGGFALPAVIRNLRSPPDGVPTAVKLSRVFVNWVTLWRQKMLIGRSGLIGVYIGIIPGVGEDVAAWSSYAAAKRAAGTDESFGRGDIRGVIAPEVANNSCIGGAIIPVLTLAVPGSPPAAMLLGAMWLHGVRPGPMLAVENPEFIAQLAAILGVACFAMAAMGLLLARVSVRVLQLPPAMLNAAVIVLAVLGSWALGLNIFNVYLMFMFGVLVYFLEELGYPVAPMVIGLILGNMADVSLRRALLVSEGSLLPFVTRPIALILVLLIAFALVARTQVWRRLIASIGRRLRQRST